MALGFQGQYLVLAEKAESRRIGTHTDRNSSVGMQVQDWVKTSGSHSVVPGPAGPAGSPPPEELLDVQNLSDQKSWAWGPAVCPEQAFHVVRLQVTDHWSRCKEERLDSQLLVNAQVIHGLCGEIQTPTIQGVDLFIVGRPSYFFIFNIRCTRCVESDTVDLPQDSVVLLSWISSPSTLCSLVNRLTYVSGGWQMLGLYLGLYYRVKLSDLNGVWNHDLGPVLYYNQLS